METVIDVLREGAIILLVVAIIGGGGFFLIRTRATMGGGIDDHLRLSENEKINRIKKWALGITGVAWVLIFIFAASEDRGRFTEAMKGLFGFVSEQVEEVRPKTEQETYERPKDLPEIPSR